MHVIARARRQAPTRALTLLSAQMLPSATFYSLALKNFAPALAAFPAISKRARHGIIWPLGKLAGRFPYRMLL